MVFRKKRFVRRKRPHFRKRFTKKRRSFRKRKTSFGRKTTRPTQHITRTVTLETQTVPSCSTSMPPLAQSYNTQVNFRLSALKNKLQFNKYAGTGTGPGNAEVSMWDMYDQYKIKKAVVTWRHSPGKGQAASSPVTPYSGSYYNPYGYRASIQANVSSPNATGLSDVTSLPYGKKSGAFGGRRTFYPKAIMLRSLYSNDFVQGVTPTISTMPTPENRWFLCNNPGPDEDVQGADIQFIGPCLLLPGMTYTGGYFTAVGTTPMFEPGNWEITLSVSVMFKGNRFGWGADASTLVKLANHPSMAITQPPTEGSMIHDAADALASAGKEAIITFGTAAARAAIEKYANKQEL